MVFQWNAVESRPDSLEVSIWPYGCNFIPPVRIFDVAAQESLDCLTFMIG